MIEIISWNRSAPRFLKAPAFEWKSSVPAKKYRVDISPLDTEQKITFNTQGTRIDFASYWAKLPCCEIRWVITAFDGRGREVERSAFLKFFKADDRFVPRKTHVDWQESAEKNVRYLLTTNLPDKPLAKGEKPPRWGAAKNYDPTMPIYVWHACYMDWKFPKECAFPACHFTVLIRMFLQYAESGRNAKMRAKGVEQARLLGKLLKRFSWPASYRCGGMPASSMGSGKLGASTEGQNYSLTRSAWAGSGLLQLATFTGEKSYRTHALHIANKLRSFQRRDGSYPMRVNPKTGEETAAYTSSGITAAIFYDELIQSDPSLAREWGKVRDKAVEWMLENPVKTNRWEGVFEDVDVQRPYENLCNLEAIQMVRYLSAHAADDSSYVRTAEKIHEWIEDQFVVYGRDDSQKNLPPVPSVYEQFLCPYPMEAHTAYWVEALLALYRATGKKIYLSKAFTAADAIVDFQAEDGRFYSFAPDRILQRPVIAEEWFGSSASASLTLLRIAKQYPELRTKA